MEARSAEGVRSGSLLLAIATAISVSIVICFTLLCASGVWNFDAHGHPIVNDFVGYWSAGKLTLQGHALAAYNPAVRHAAEIATVGHSFKDIIGWWYPPLFLFIAAALACLPYAIAFVAMNDITLIVHAGVTAAIVRKPRLAPLVVLPPWALIGMVHGQNQFLSASLIGAVLLTLEKRPALSGILLGLLSYKPQFGLLFPIALAFGGYWRAFAWAVVGTVFWTSLSGVVFGFDTLVGFAHGLSTWSHNVFETNAGYVRNLQSLYGLSRTLGLSEGLSWMLQWSGSILGAIAIAVLWRSKAPFDLKAAGLATAIPFVTPYVFVYDLTLLSVALSFLYRHGAFDRWDWTAIALVLVSVGVFGWGKADPIGVFACAAIATLILRRLQPAIFQTHRIVASGPDSVTGPQSSLCNSSRAATVTTT